MFSKRKTYRKGIVAGFCWLGLFLALLLAYWWVMTNYVIRDFWDPSFVTKSELLKARLKEYPNHPLWLVMGSSHVDDGLQPGVLLQGGMSGNAPLIFNFGTGGADLYRQYVCLRRLVAEGIKPKRVGIEILGAPLSDKREIYADDPKLVCRARRDEIGDLCLRAADPGAARGSWIQSRCNPFFKYGMKTPYQTLKWRLIPIPAVWRRMESSPYDEWGWYKVPPGPIAMGIYSGKLEGSREAYQFYFQGEYVVSANSDKSLRQMLDFCRSAGIGAFLLRMPEDRDFQAFYPAQANAAIDSYLAKIENDCGVPMIDARSWFPDRDNFVDGHHLNATGGEIFTRRLAAELPALKP